MNRTLTLFFILPVLLIGGCATTGGKTKAEKRQAVLAMKKEVLADLYKIKPDVKAQIAKAPGYAVFSNANVNVIFASFSGGYGVVRNNKTGKHTFMKMGEIGAAVGYGIKDYRAVIIFHNSGSMKSFIKSGWAFGAQADAAFKAGDKGGAAAREAIAGNVTVYQLTETGLALQAIVKGTKYWKDAELN